MALVPEECVCVGGGGGKEDWALYLWDPTLSLGRYPQNWIKLKDTPLLSRRIACCGKCHSHIWWPEVKCSLWKEKRYTGQRHDRGELGFPLHRKMEDWYPLYSWYQWDLLDWSWLIETCGLGWRERMKEWGGWKTFDSWVTRWSPMVCSSCYATMGSWGKSYQWNLELDPVPGQEVHWMPKKMQTNK